MAKEDECIKANDCCRWVKDKRMSEEQVSGTEQTYDGYCVYWEPYCGKSDEERKSAKESYELLYIVKAAHPSYWEKDNL